MMYTELIQKMQSPIQSKTHLKPRLHNMNDSAAEMLTVAKDTIARRSRIPQATTW